MPNLKLIECLNERIDEHVRNIAYHEGRVEAIKQDELALREKVSRLSKEIDKDYGNK